MCSSELSKLNVVMATTDDLEEPDLHRLEGIREVRGGLIRKGPSLSRDQSPKMSQWGLDKLAVEKREERSRKEKEKNRKYRERFSETPGGGISDSIRENIAK